MKITIMYNSYGEPVVYDTSLVAYKHTEDKIQYFYAPGCGTKTGRTFRLIFYPGTGTDAQGPQEDREGDSVWVSTAKLPATSPKDC